MVEDSIERLKKALYSKNTVIKDVHRRALPKEEGTAPTSWETDAYSTAPVREAHHISKKALIGGVAFFTIALVIALVSLFGGRTSVSGDNIAIRVTGPVSAAGGAEVPLDIEVTNGNNVELKTVDLKIEYPSGTRSPSDLETELTRTREIIGDIGIGESARKSVRVVLFGEENLKKTIVVTAEYRVPGSNAIFEKKQSYDILLSSSPVSVTVEGLTEANANQQLSFTVAVVSNSTSVIKNLLLEAVFPFGFTLVSSSPEPVSTRSIWSVGDLAPGGKRTIRITGKLAGEDGEERVFRFVVGAASGKDNQVIATPFISAQPSVFIRKPFVGVDLALDGTAVDPYIARSGKLIRADLVWTNNTPATVKDAVIEVKLSGPALNRSLVSAEQGFYRSVDNTVVFDKTRVPQFASLAPGQTGRLSFSFGSVSSQSLSGSALSNAEIGLELAVRGKRSEGDAVPQENLFSAVRKIKIASDIKLSAKTLYFAGSLKNTGPVPPKADTPTTYTIVWSVANTSNDLSNATVRTVLPPYVSWTGESNPSFEKVSHNADTGEVVWDIGTVKARTGVTSAAKELSFKVTLLPSLSQVGTAPTLTGDVVLSGTDVFTSSTLSDTKPAPTTQFASDPQYRNGLETVVE